MMRRSFVWVGALLLAVAGLAAQRTEAFITTLTPLRGILADSQFIFTVKVDALDPDRPSVVLIVDEDLKGKAPFRRLPVNLTGDQAAQKAKHPAQLLKRLAPKLPLVVFVRQRGDRFDALAYTNGTWFQMVGHRSSDTDAVRWAFTHCEPYLRRTFKGTTAELRQVIGDALAGKKTPPEPDPREPPGLGPEVPENDDGGTRKDERPEAGGSFPSSFLAPCSSCGRGPVFAVIPTVLVGGPAAILAMLFPALFGGLILLLRRWAAVLTVASLNSTLFLLHGWLYPSIRDRWWGTPAALWVAMTLITIAGIFWAWRRHRRAVRAGEAGQPPRRIEQIVLGLLTLAGAGMVGYCLVSRQSLLAPLPRSMLVIWVGVWAGMLYTLYLVGTGRRWPADRPIPSMEGIMLGAMALTSAGLTAATWPRPAGPVRAEVVWTFEVPRPEQGRIVSTPLVEGGRLYAAAALGSGFPYGALYCLDRETGRPRADFNRGRPFDDGGDLKQVFSSPCAADGRLYLGEGFHQDSFCKLYCLDAATGQKLWHVPTKGHTESSPCVADGKVYIGAGDDGLYCVEAVRGKVLWHFEGPHVDCTPVVVDGRLYGGSGYGTYEVFCLDARTGNLVWRVPVDLPAFATPAATPDGRVVFGIGNGNLLASAGTPAGALLCLDGRTGALLWRFDVGDGVHRQPAVDDRHVYCVTRDCHCYCVRLADGALVWKKELNSPVAAAPALARSPQHDGRPGLYIAASRGTIYCLDPDTGAVRWTFDVAEHSQAQPLLLSSPIVVTDPTGSGPRRRIYFGAELVNPLLESTPAVYCLEERP